MLHLRSIFIAIPFLFVTNLVCCQNTNQEQKVTWTGIYNMKFYVEEHNDSINPQIFTIQKTSDEKAENLPSTYKTDLLRWNLITQYGEEKDTLQLRRFIMNDEYNEYEEFGWSKLHTSGEMNCLDGGHFFICKTIEGRKIEVGEEKFISTTGIFGIMLHSGLFELLKIE